MVSVRQRHHARQHHRQPATTGPAAADRAAGRRHPGRDRIAILRYQLYDIDRLISRTLVYALLTALLGAVYAGVVLVMGQVSGGIGTKPPPWAVAGATLAAALFQPARRRIQQVVDRRFNRRKYNTAKTIQEFSTRLRDQVDLDTLSTELLAVVDQTMEPTRVSLWLRPSPPGSSGTPRSEARPTTWAYYYKRWFHNGRSMQRRSSRCVAAGRANSRSG
jgi:hypothetical protein